MTATSFEEFKRVFKKIPEDRLKYVHFIKLRQGGKRPYEVASWRDDASTWLTYFGIKKWMNRGGNIGIVALPKGIMFLDIDVDENGKIISPEIKNIADESKTLTVKTRSSGYHYYYLNDGIYPTQNIDIDGITIGELRANTSYVLSAGSYIEKTAVDDIEGSYRIEKDMPIQSLPDTLSKYFYINTDETKTAHKKKPAKQISPELQKIVDNIKYGDKRELISNERRVELLKFLKKEVI